MTRVQAVAITKTAQLTEAIDDPNTQPVNLSSGSPQRDVLRQAFVRNLKYLNHITDTITALKEEYEMPGLEQKNNLSEYKNWQTKRSIQMKKVRKLQLWLELPESLNEAIWQRNSLNT